MQLTQLYCKRPKLIPCAKFTILSCQRLICHLAKDITQQGKLVDKWRRASETFSPGILAHIWGVRQSGCNKRFFSTMHFYIDCFSEYLSGGYCVIKYVNFFLLLFGEHFKMHCGKKCFVAATLTLFYRMTGLIHQLGRVMVNPSLVTLSVGIHHLNNANERINSNSS